MKMYEFALVNKENNEFIGLVLTGNPLEHRNNLIIHRYDNALGELSVLKCDMRSGKGDLEAVSHLKYKTIPYVKRYEYHIQNAQGLSSISVRDFDESNDNLYRFIEKLRTSTNEENMKTYSALNVFNMIGDFVAMFDENAPRLLIKDLPEDAFIYTKEHGVLMVEKVLSENNGKLQINATKYSLSQYDDLFINENQIIELENKEYRVYGALDKYNIEYSA